jgi:ABC-2 type transport system permease protein
MARYWRVYRAFVRSALIRELEFKANFFAKIGQNVVWIGFFVLLISVFFGKSNQLAGWNRGEALVLGATVFIMNSLTTALFPALNEISEMVRTGTLDFVITRPIDSQFWVSMRKFNFDQIGTLLAGLAMLAIGIGRWPTLVSLSAYVLSVGISLALFYALSLVLMTTSVWFIRLDNLFVLTESVSNVARFPLGIYPTGLQRFLTYGIPFAFLGTIPTGQLMRHVDLILLGWGVGWAVVALVASRYFWQFALARYGSASS